MLTADQRAEAADRLHAAERDRSPIRPLVVDYPGIDAVDAVRRSLPVLANRRV